MNIQKSLLRLDYLRPDPDLLRRIFEIREKMTELNLDENDEILGLHNIKEKYHTLEEEDIESIDNSNNKK